MSNTTSRADETLANRQPFRLDCDQWKAFMAALDAPPRHHPRMERLLKEPSIFERNAKDLKRIINQ